MDDRPLRRQRVRGRAGRRRDDEAVGAHRVDEAAVDLDRASRSCRPAPRLTTTSFSASASWTTTPSRADRRREQRAPLLDVAPGRASPPSTSSIRASGMSVRKPSRPWLMPISGTSCGASSRAIDSIVPSPPTTIATSTVAAHRAARHGRDVLEAGLAGGVGVEHDLVAARGEERGERGQRLGDARGVGTADQRDAAQAGPRGAPAIRPAMRPRRDRVRRRRPPGCGRRRGGVEGHGCD